MNRLKLDIQRFADGEIIIGTSLDSKQLEKDLNSAKKKLEKYEKEATKLLEQKQKAKLDLRDYEKAKKIIEDTTKTNLKFASTEKGKKKVLEEQKIQLQQLDDAYAKQLYKYESINKKIEENKINQKITNEEIEKTTSNIEKAKTAEEEFNKEMKRTEERKQTFENIRGSIDNVGNSMQKAIKKVAKWALAIFGIRSAYMLVRQAMSTLSQYDDQLSANIEYIRYALANVLKPIIETIINLAYKLLAYTAYIAKAWFGVELFANASADAFVKSKKALKDNNKEAKELQKTLAGFDEMNILQENGGTTIGGGGGGITAPNIDLGNWKDIEIPDWVQWIADNGDKVAGILLGIASGLTAIRLGANLIQGLGIGIIAYGIYQTIEGILKFIDDPSWENFVGILKGISTVLAGIGVILLTFNTSNPVGWALIAIGVFVNFNDVIQDLVGGLTGLGVVITALTGVFIRFNVTNPIGWIGMLAGITTTIIGVFGDWGSETKKITKELKDTKQATDDLRKAQEELASQTSTYTNAVKNAEKTQKTLEEAERRNKMSGQELFNAVKIGTLNYKNMNDAQREVFDAYVANMEAEEKLTDATKKFTQAQDYANKSSGALSGAVYQETGQMDEYFTQLMKGYQEGKVETDIFYKALDGMLRNMDKDTKKTFVDSLPTDIKDGIKNSTTEIKTATMFSLWTTKMQLLVDDAKQTFGTDIPNEMQKGLSSNKLTSIFDNVKTSWNKMIGGLQSNINISANTTSTGGKYNAKGAIYYPSKLPKLAVGGIINMPGSGVPYHGAYIGERGAEAVVPLTDSQQMQLLGEAIGKYITVNANITNTMNGRVISRELQKVQNDSNFAYNR